MSEDKKRSANFVLVQMSEEETSQSVLWREIKDGFISPERALEYAKENKIQGAIRVFRIASPVYGGSVVIPEPVYTLTRIDEPTEKKPRKARTGRKARFSETTTSIPPSSSLVIGPEPSPIMECGPCGHRGPVFDGLALNPCGEILAESLPDPEEAIPEDLDATI